MSNEAAIDNSRDVKHFHDEQIKKGFLSCSICKRSSGLRYNYPDRKIRGITLKYTYNQKGEKVLICLDCDEKGERK